MLVEENDEDILWMHCQC